MIKQLDDLPGWRHLELDSVESTNADALKLAQNGDAGQIWVTARQQTKGRARRGRNWVSERGNLYSSCLLIDPAPPEELIGLPMVVSLALHKALVEAVPSLGEKLRIKWPNDLLLEGKKLSGILLEATRVDNGKLAVVIGCGVNCTHFPDEPLYPATSLKNFGVSLEPQDLFGIFAASLAQELRIWAKGAGFSIIRREWLERAQGIGKTITARFSDHEVTGRFLDIDADGKLLLEDENRHVQKISAADIFFGHSTIMSA